MRLLQLPPRLILTHPLTLPWLWLALLWGLSSRLPQLAPWAGLAAVLLLATLPAWGLWLAFMIRKRARHLRFAKRSWLRRWFSGGWWPAIKAIPAALALAGVALCQAWFLAPREWLLLALAPLLYLALVRGLNAVLAAQYVRPAFTWASAHRLSRWIFTVLLGALWLALMLHGTLDARAANPAMTAPALDQAVADIAAARSGLVRWGLDSLLALQVIGDAVRDLPQSQTLRIILLTLSGPGVMLWALACLMQGTSGLNRSLLRAARLKPARQGHRRATLTAFMAALLFILLLPPLASLDALMQRHPSPLALQRLPACERIDGDYYTVGTTQALRQTVLQTLRQTRADTAFCAQTADMAQALDAALDRYLDWYFGLGAEWGRILHLLAGGADAFLEQRLERTLQETPGLAPWLQAVETRERQMQDALARGESRLQQTLQAHHLVLNANRCLVQNEGDTLPELQTLTSVRQRVAAGTATGVGAGAFAGAVAAKAMGKVGMKAAAKVLAKAAAKQGAGKAAAIATGAALGSIVPGAGTAAGALTGAALGTLVGAGIDWTALRVEESVTRDGMKAELAAALREQMDGLATAMGCASDGAEAAARPGQ